MDDLEYLKETYRLIDRAQGRLNIQYNDCANCKNSDQYNEIGYSLLEISTRLIHIKGQIDRVYKELLKLPKVKKSG